MTTTPTQPLETINTAMQDIGGLAPRTIANHLKSASTRGWISVRRGVVTARRIDLIRTHLKAVR